VSPSSKNSARDTKHDPWPPRWLTPVPTADIARGDGDYCADFIGEFCRITKDSIGGPAGKLITVLPDQRELYRHLFARTLDGKYRHRTALIGKPRKNGKSSEGAGIALFGLTTGPDGGEVYSCAADKEQARIVFGTAKRMVEMDPELSQIVNCYRDALEVPETGSVYRVLSAEAFTKEGLNPHLVLFDEVHAQPNREFWDVMSLAMGSRREPMLIGITTAGVRTDTTGSDSLCYSMYQYGKRVASGEVEDPTFFFAWWEPQNPNADHRAPETWASANPGFGTLVDEADFRSAVRRTPESEFRTKRCNQWVSTNRTWLPAGRWEALSAPEKAVPERSRVVVGFDGSMSGDSTAVVGVTVEETPHIFLIGLWEKPKDDLNWKVPRAEVKDAIRAACRTWDVVETPWDEYLWLDAQDELSDERIPVVGFPQNITRMGPATQRMYEAVIDGAITHDGDPRLARHFDNCVLKSDSRGSRVVKDKPNSARKIDAAVAAIMALDRAAWHFQKVSADLSQNIW
jgi:phage terminase large subunit-like protein